MDIREGGTAVDEESGFLIGEAARVAGGAGQPQRSHLRIRLGIA